MGLADNPNYGARGSTRRHHHRPARPTRPHERSASQMLAVYDCQRCLGWIMKSQPHRLASLRR
jgi:hypothetical protein